MKRKISVEDRLDLNDLIARHALATRDTDEQWRLKTLFVDIWRGDNVPWVGDKRAWTKETAEARA